MPITLGVLAVVLSFAAEIVTTNAESGIKAVVVLGVLGDTFIGLTMWFVAMTALIWTAPSSRFYAEWLLLAVGIVVLSFHVPELSAKVVSIMNAAGNFVGLPASQDGERESGQETILTERR